MHFSLWHFSLPYRLNLILVQTLRLLCEIQQHEEQTYCQTQCEMNKTTNIADLFVLITWPKDAQVNHKAPKRMQEERREVLCALPQRITQQKASNQSCRHQHVQFRHSDVLHLCSLSRRKSMQALFYVTRLRRLRFAILGTRIATNTTAHKPFETLFRPCFCLGAGPSSVIGSTDWTAERSAV